MTRFSFATAVISAIISTAGCSMVASDPPTPSPAPPHTVTVSPSDRPTRLVIPAIDVDDGLQPVGLLPSGAMETPPFGKVGWYGEGPPPGARGAAVVVAHVHGPQGNDVFFRLHELRRHDRFRVTTTGGTVEFEVDETVLVPKEKLPYERLWPETTERRLSLITCGGKPTAAGYPSNTIVFAHAV